MRDAGVAICTPPEVLIWSQDFRDGAARIRRLIAQIAQPACVSSDPDWRQEG